MSYSQETMSHTPGPWEAIGADVRTCRKADGGGGLEIARGSLFWPERKANALLIAAAPELLALAKQYAEECATCGGFGECDLPVEGTDDELESVPCIDCADIRAVIAKAEGR